MKRVLVEASARAGATLGRVVLVVALMLFPDSAAAGNDGRVGAVGPAEPCRGGVVRDERAQPGSQDAVDVLVYGGWRQLWGGDVNECQESRRTDRFSTLADAPGPGSRSSRVDLEEDKDDGCGRCGNRVLRGFQAPCGRVLCVHGGRRRPRPRRWRSARRSGSVESGLRRGVRARLCRPDPRDRPELRQTGPVPAVLPRFRPVVQSETAPRAPTPWTSPSGRRPVVSAADPSPSARRVTAAMPTARRGAGRPPAAGRSGPPGPSISAVPKGASTTATGNAPTAPGAA